MTVTADETAVTRNRVDWATVPRVNLLPPEILENRSFRRNQLIMAAAVVASVVLGGAVTLWSQHEVTAAERERDIVAARTTELRGQLAALDEVPRVIGQVDGARQARERAMANDVLWYRFMDELAVTTPNQVWLRSLQVGIDGDVAAPATDALTPPGIGEMTVSGTAARFTDVAQWLTSVVGVNGMAISRLQTATNDTSKNADERIAFSAIVSVNREALSHRYDRKAG